MDVLFSTTLKRSVPKTLKYCPLCKKDKSIDHFMWRGGVSFYCNDCDNRIDQHYKNKEAQPWEKRARRYAVKTEKIDREFIIKRDKSTCHICGKKVAFSKIELDHIIPISKGGEHTQANVAVAHKKCNRQKYNKVYPVQIALFDGPYKLMK